ncbi:unnamed protein product [Rotaria sp. Silwood2]|nr:unnamed protein product [Rotaria sp. Silwood2]
MKKTEQIFIDLPYFNKTTEQLGKKLIKIASSIRPQLQVQPIPRAPPSVSTYFTVKDAIPTQLQSNVVYKINCLECPASYIGKTVRQIERRTHEHGKPLTINNNNQDQSTTTGSQHTSDRPKRTTKPIERYGIDSNSHYQEQPKQQPNVQPNTSKSALGKHTNEQQHQIDWDTIKILDKDTNDYRLKIRESIAIKQHNPTLNRTVNSVPLLIFPAGIPTRKPKHIEGKGKHHNNQQ